MFYFFFYFLVCLLNWLGLKISHRFCHFGLKMGVVVVLRNLQEHICVEILVSIHWALTLQTKESKRGDYRIKHDLLLWTGLKTVGL